MLIQKILYDLSNIIIILFSGKSKEEIKEEEEKIIRKVVEEKMDIQGGYAKPKITDILWIQLVLLPVTMWNWTYFYSRWFWKFGILKEEYGEEEKLYVIRKNMSLSQGQFDVSISIVGATVLPQLVRPRTFKLTSPSGGVLTERV